MNIKQYDPEIQTLNDELLKQRSLMSKKIVKCCNALIKKAKSLDDINLEGLLKKALSTTKRTASISEIFCCSTASRQIAASCSITPQL